MQSRPSSPTVGSSPPGRGESGKGRRPQTPPHRPAAPKDWVFTTPAAKPTPQSPPPARRRPLSRVEEVVDGDEAPPAAGRVALDDLVAFRAALSADPPLPTLAGEGGHGGHDDLAALWAALFADPPPPFGGDFGQAALFADPPPLFGGAFGQAALFADPPPPFGGAFGRAAPWVFAAPFGPQPR